MKPISSTTRNSRSFPLVEFHYQPGLLGYKPRCAKSTAPAFRSISNQYFQRHARRDFIAEAIFFVAIAFTAAVPLFNTASALTDFCRAIGQF